MGADQGSRGQLSNEDGDTNEGARQTEQGAGGDSPSGQLAGWLGEAITGLIAAVIFALIAIGVHLKNFDQFSGLHACFANA